jgi:glycosyltransferase involved in cell wall biosynthesis
VLGSPAYLDPSLSDAPLHGRSIVVISSIDWDFLWQGHQEIASRLARMGNDVVYVENTGVRTVRFGDASRVVRRALRLLSDRGPRRGGDADGVHVVPPLLLPFPRSRAAALINETFLLPRLVAGLRSLAGPDPVVFTFLPTPLARRLVESIRGAGSVIVYYCIADFRELSDLGVGLVASEAALVRSADVVFVQAEAFAERFRYLNANIHVFQFGVDLSSFRVTAPSVEVTSLAKPVIGYSGGIHRHVDIGLLANIAEAYPHATILLVGPLQAHVDALRAIPNVRFFGHRAFRDLPSLVAGFDVALIPYLRSAYTDTVFPTKLFEYLAMGRSVVSTDLPEVRKLGLPPWAVRIAPHVDAFVAAVGEALRDPPALAAERVALAQARDWDAIVRRMAEHIAAAAR